jgi:hypothetical protein
LIGAEGTAIAPTPLTWTRRVEGRRGIRADIEGAVEFGVDCIRSNVFFVPSKKGKKERERELGKVGKNEAWRAKTD